MQIEWLHTIQSIRSPVLDLFFRGLNFFDTESFYILLIPAIWFSRGWRVGLRLFMLILLSLLAVQELKQFFSVLRPFHTHPPLALIHVSGFSFPSGGATNSLLLALLFLTYSKMRYKWCIAITYCIFISFSRLYLGVHYPIDILGGWVLGALLWSIGVYLFPLIERQLQRLPILALWCISQIIPLIPFLCRPRTLPWIICMGMMCALFVIKNTITTHHTPLRGFLAHALLLCYTVFFFPLYLYTPHSPILWLHSLSDSL